MKLYYSPGACSLASHIVLKETGVPFELVKVDTRDHKTETGDDYYAINPKGAVAALRLDDGSVLTEGSAIMQYVGDHAPGSTVMPKAGTMERYREIEWLNWVASELHKGFAPLFNKDYAAKAGEFVRANIGKKLTYLDKHLATHEYLMGSTFTAADAYAFTILTWAKPLDVDLSAYKNVVTFQSRVAARPAVQETLKAEGLLK